MFDVGYGVYNIFFYFVFGVVRVMVRLVWNLVVVIYCLCKLVWCGDIVVGFDELWSESVVSLGEIFESGFRVY